MPFRDCSIMSERAEFCRLAVAPGANVRGLCRRFGLGSPRTAYKWIERYRAGGLAALADRSRRPHAGANRSSAEVEARIVALRGEHPCWGGRKLRRLLEWEGVAPVPAASTITAILRRHGLLDGPGAGVSRDWVRFEHPAPNDLWQMDFKGHFPLASGRCHPLTLIDDHSRYALMIGACADEREATVRSRLERLFRRYGLPRRILADNGPPWGAGEPLRFTRLGVWLLDLDIAISHGKPRHPQTQGKEERFHRTLKAEVLAGRSFADLVEAQAAFDVWREVYNTRRPHEAIGLEVPASRYRASARDMPHAIEPPDYEPQTLVRVVCAKGRITLKGRQYRFSKAFAGRRIALRATSTDGVFDLCYRRHILAQVDLRQDVTKSVHHVPEQGVTLSPV
ncbi:MAG TPA: IS481 family transposase [Allosphingosinicella sp.]|nr:IS481 family transposase [Allosphingosinicella sp.]